MGSKTAVLSGPFRKGTVVSPPTFLVAAACTRRAFSFPLHTRCRATCLLSFYAYLDLFRPDFVCPALQPARGRHRLSTESFLNRSRRRLLRPLASYSLSELSYTSPLKFAPHR